MKNSEMEFNQFYREQLRKEGEKIKAELESDPTLVDVEAPPEMKEALWEKIVEYEKEQGRSPSTKYMVKRNKKIFLVVALITVLLLGFGMTGIGNKLLQKRESRQEVQKREIRQNGAEENYQMIAGETEEEQAYQQVEDFFGMVPVRPIYWPEGTEFLDAAIDPNMQIAQFTYSYKEQRISYQIIVHYVENSFAQDNEDDIIESKAVQLETTEVEITKYKEGKNERYKGVFEYKDVHYVLTGKINEEEFEKILKNLHFF